MTAFSLLLHPCRTILLSLLGCLVFGVLSKYCAVHGMGVRSGTFVVAYVEWGVWGRCVDNGCPRKGDFEDGYGLNSESHP